MVRQYEKHNRILCICLLYIHCTHFGSCKQYIFFIVPIKIIVIGKADPGTISYGYMLKDDGSLNPLEADFDNSKNALLPYSSGTTGLPKGVMLTSRNVISNICQVIDCRGLSYVEETTGKITLMCIKNNYCLPENLVFLGIKLEPNIFQTTTSRKRSVSCPCFMHS